MPDEQMPLQSEGLPRTQDPTAPLRADIEFGELKAKHEQLLEAHNSLKNDRDRLAEALDAKHGELTQLQQAHGVVVRPAYEYGDDECRPVVPGAVCEKCGWVNDPASPRYQRRPNDEKREPHPVSA